ncbi:PREDICTED: cytochrome P450 4V2 [Myotis davidii]|uniref:cytochrome P450 4V2 n=1 Tax=Myotis davidii TaxID=225400 RepID=UPI00076704E5|nr:PREDICTED: cytochrome P450 4V2 [Myotis davidii]
MDLREELARLMRPLHLDPHLAAADNQLPQLQIAAAPNNPLKIRSGRRTRQTTNSLEVTRGMVKKMVQEAARICEDTRTRERLRTAVSLACATLILSFLQLMATYAHNWLQMRPIPSIPYAYPFLGHGLMVERGGKEFFQQVIYYTEQNRHVPMLKAWLGTVPVIAMYKAETIEVILTSSKQIDKSYLYTFLQPWLGLGLLTRAPEKPYPLPGLRAEPTCQEGQREEGAGTGKTAMGKNIDAQTHDDSEYVRAVYRMTDLLHRRMKTIWFWHDVLYLLFKDGRDHKRNLKILHNFTTNVINERANEIKRYEERKSDDKGMTLSKRKHKAFLDLLLNVMDDEGNKLSHEAIREEVDTFMFEGHDTTAAGINWALYLLGCYPEVQKTLDSELEEVFETPYNLCAQCTEKGGRKLEFCALLRGLSLQPPAEQGKQKVFLSHGAQGH